MLNVLIIAGALASVGVASRESLVASPEESSTIYHSPFTISTLYSLIYTLRYRAHQKIQHRGTRQTTQSRIESSSHSSIRH